MALMDKVRSFMGYDDEDYEDEYEYEVEENRALAPRKAERARTEEMTMPAPAAAFQITSIRTNRFEDASLVVDELKLPEIKTKAVKDFMNAAGVTKSVLITPEVDEIVVKSARNIPGVVTTTAKILSVYDIVNAKQLVIDKAALAIIEEVYA